MFSKKKIFISMILLVIGLTFSTSVFAKSDFDIQVIDGMETLVKYNGNGTTVTVPNGVKVIGDDAFENNKKVEKVKLPNSVKTIRYNAFRGCANLKNMRMPENLRRIWNGAFVDCKSLKTITINKKLKQIDEFVFAGCENLKKIKIAKGNKKFRIYKKALYSKNLKNIYLYPPAAKGKKVYVIPENVKKVDAYAFSYNKNLTQIIIKGKIRAGEGAFIKCKALEKVVFEKTAKGSPEFSNCKKLEEVVLAEGTKMIGEAQFKSCKNLKTINFPSTLELIDMYAFRGCKYIKESDVPSNVECENAF